ncbi:hypothetical protein OSB04_031411 [Centaurea solstitialis]|uniref:Protein kinase domain-containing protein n=1 Tax=Centaurea solstitialis TaxID=347529 RepID=A0AA38SAA5_9ASTR|nr:hypothetical protein OSB04_031411 [Centaurea solstitialis]
MAVFRLPLFTFFLFSLVLRHYRVTSEPTQDKQTLLSFLSQVPHSRRISWNSADSACSWIGVTCDATNSSVKQLRLPGAGLLGGIPPNTIGKLSQLRVLSLRSNGLTGGIPSDFSNLAFLRSVYLQDNRFSGGFPASLSNLNRVVRLDLSGNEFSGEIPFGINSLTQLTGLFLQNNSFSGQIPSINQGSLVLMNVSNNRLNGSIPKSLSRFPVTAFSGNINLCGPPLPPCNNSFFPSPTPAPSSIEPPPVGKKSKNNKLSTGAIVAIAVGSALILALILLILLLFLRRKRKQQNKQPPKPPLTAAAAAAASRSVAETGGTSSSKDDLTGASTEGERNKLVFFDGGIYSFDLEDLLRASAEVLGKGSVGTSYKAVLEEGTTVVVKRLKDVAVTKKEFESQMEILGKMKNENVVPLRAFYYSKDEKLLVYDYMPAGSLSALLHGSRGSGRTPLDWDHRMRIALSAARGVAYLHVAGKVVHGNIKASNILLRQETNKDASVSDFGLNSLFSVTSSPNNRVTGYRARRC